MEIFDMGLIKREPLEEFNNDSTYFDQIMPYTNDVFDPSIDWLSCNLNDDRATSSNNQIVDQFNTISDYSNMVLNSVNRDQTLNRINEFDHRLEGGNHDLDCEMKSFYCTSHRSTMYNHPNYNLATADIMNTGTSDKERLQKHELAAVPVKLEELEDTIRMSAGESDQERDESESGETDQSEYLELKPWYDSGGHSPNSDTPGTPPQCLILGQIEQERNTYGGVVDIKSTSNQPKTRQPFFLSEEEKRTLITEGLPIPSGYPLTKSEERALKKVRRKIKNKISAQESRRKKKEYMETLEKRVELCTNENLDLRKRLESMETNNRNLINQLKKMQALLSSRVSRPLTTSTTQTNNDV